MFSYLLDPGTIAKARFLAASDLERVTDLGVPILGGAPFWGPYYRGILLFGGLYEGSLIFVKPPFTDQRFSESRALGPTAWSGLVVGSVRIWPFWGVSSPGFQLDSRKPCKP